MSTDDQTIQKWSSFEFFVDSQASAFSFSWESERKEAETQMFPVPPTELN